MKTKHLFFATALMASLAACTNEEIVFDTPQNVVKDRPTVDNVELNFIGEGADSRVTFGANGYAWEATDIIGALLMDNVKTLGAEKTWLDKYELVNYIHTSYPFTYSDGIWSSNAKMLEGNYFFAYPWSSYDGNRQVLHKLTAQEQNGIGTDVVAKSYGKNQFFVGYSQIMAGVEAKDALADVTMTPILGAVQLRIVNTGTQVRHINKVVLKGDGLTSVLTLDPTDGEYEGGCYDIVSGTDDNQTTTHWFNYANYTDNLYDVTTWGGSTKVNNAKESYNRDEALRAIVKPVGDEKFAQLNINGTADERKLVPNAGNIAYALIMANPVEVKNTDETEGTTLKLDIYTDEGIVKDIDLSVINETAGDYKALTDVKIDEIAPGVANTIKVQVDDNSFVVPQKMDVYTDDDLYQLIMWNCRNVEGARAIEAALVKPATLTKEMVSMLNASKHTLKITGTNALTLAVDVPANALDAKNLIVSAPIKVLGAVELTRNTGVLGNITIAEGAEMSINDVQAVIPSAIVNNGTLSVGKEAIVAASTTITNNGVVDIADGADVKAEVVNNATLNNNGWMKEVENSAKSVVNLGEGAILSTSTNSGIINTAKNSQVGGTNYGRINYVDGAVIVVTNNGEIAAKVTGTVAKNVYKAAGVNTFDVSGITVISDTQEGLKYIVAEDGTTLKIADGVNLTDLVELKINGSVTFISATTYTGDDAGKNSNIEVGTLLVNEEAVLVNNGKIDADNIVNNGAVHNNIEGGITLPNGGAVQGKGTWKYEPVTNRSAEAVVVNAYGSIVSTWWNELLGASSSYIGGDYYNYNPYDVNCWGKLIANWYTCGVAAKVNMAKALVETKWALGNVLDLPTANGEGNETFVKAIAAKLAADVDFAEAVDSEIMSELTTAEKTALKNEIVNAKTGVLNVSGFTLTQETEIYSTESEAMDNLVKDIVETLAGSDVKKNAKYVNVWQLKNEIVTALAETSFSGSIGSISEQNVNGAYAYIWEGKDIHELMSAISVFTVEKWNTYLGLEGNNALASLNTRAGAEAWMEAVYTTSNTSDAISDAKVVVKKYRSAAKNWQYSDNQYAAAAGGN